MEDAVIASNDVQPGTHFFGVYDGHGGAEVANFVKDNLINHLKQLESFKSKKYEQSFKDIYLKLDQMLLGEGAEEMLLDGADEAKLKNIEAKKRHAELIGPYKGIAWETGCTACSAIITPNKIVVGNLGDSRAVLAKQ